MLGQIVANEFYNPEGCTTLACCIRRNGRNIGWGLMPVCCCATIAQKSWRDKNVTFHE